MSATAPELPPEVRSDLEALGARFVGWRWETRNGKPTKPPLAVSGGYADITDPATWSPLEVVLAAVRAGRLPGLGLVLVASQDGIVGIDLDSCRNPQTGAITPAATRIIGSINSYTEVSPSGTGVKILCRADPLPELRANVRILRKANGSGRDEKVEAYTAGRYFCLTGLHLDGTPEEITDATEAVERLAAWIAKKPAKEGPPLPSAFVALLGRDAKLRKAWEKGRSAKLGQGADDSASGLDASLAVYLARHLGDADLTAVLRAHPHGQLGGGKLKGRDAERRLKRLLELAGEARASVEKRAPAPEEGPIEELNRDHFVARQGGRTVIVRLEHDAVLDRIGHVFIGQNDLNLYYANRTVQVGTNDKGAPILKPLAAAWLRHPDRRTYERMVMDPGRPTTAGEYNLWRGWGVAPKRGKCTTILDHLEQVVCSGDEAVFLYLEHWMAFCVQRPERRPEVAVVLKGGKGTGKGAAVAPLLRIFNGHALHLTHPRHLTGNFNGHLLDALLVFADESFWAGDKVAEGVIKGLITEPVIRLPICTDGGTVHIGNLCGPETLRR